MCCFAKGFLFPSIPSHSNNSTHSSRGAACARRRRARNASRSSRRRSSRRTRRGRRPRATRRAQEAKKREPRRSKAPAQRPEAVRRRPTVLGEGIRALCCLQASLRALAAPFEGCFLGWSARSKVGVCSIECVNACSNDKESLIYMRVYADERGSCARGYEGQNTPKKCAYRRRSWRRAVTNR